MKKIFQKITVSVFCLILLCFMAAHIFMPDIDISTSERRHLASLPKFSTDSFLSGVYMQNIEKYLSDQFPMREGFRAVGSASELLYGRLDVNDIYSYNGYLSALDYNYNDSSVVKSAQKLSYAAGKFGDNIYSALIPPKDYYINDGTHPVIDFDELSELFSENFNAGKAVDITNKLSLDKYYKSDSHWKQEQITGLAGYLTESMGYNAPEIRYEENVISGFRGVYAGQSAVWMADEDIVYLTNENTGSVKVTSFGGECDRLYTTEKAESSVDMYDIFLGGAVPLIFIENDSAVNDATLVVIRDSYGSSMIPLMSAYFSKIIAVDFRYITLNNAIKFCGEKEADAVLVMLSSGIIKNSEMLKIDVK